MSSSSSSIPTSEVPEAEMAARAQALVSGFHSVMRRISAVASPDRSVCHVGDLRFCVRFCSETNKNGLDRYV